jgi:hypothetical protein
VGVESKNETHLKSEATLAVNKHFFKKNSILACYVSSSAKTIKGVSKRLRNVRNY